MAPCVGRSLQLVFPAVAVTVALAGGRVSESHAGTTGADSGNASSIRISTSAGRKQLETKAAFRRCECPHSDLFPPMSMRVDVAGDWGLHIASQEMRPGASRSTGQPLRARRASLPASARCGAGASMRLRSGMRWRANCLDLAICGARHYIPLDTRLAMGTTDS
ncbi:hypothetical protein EJ06DRAFT_275581 [Trichodelitschia bisporula]|uniref:Uncharacterized protein n=1 Tax=Trichodelitschia bisporula TaxID=703511 RepID=A0A6G1I5W5_9PEZI|nr:hypothetical protein EJ06DRAFT_275581 [Trichodelitschia bisporula]